MKSTPLLRALRPNFLVLPVTLVVLGFAVGYQSTQQWHWQAFGLTVVLSICAHAWVNLHNELTDALNGLDAQTPKTAFSGGTATLIEFPDLVPIAKRWLVVLLAILLTALMAYTYVYGWQLLILATMGGVLMLSYSRWLVTRPWLCWGAAGMAFGPLMVIASLWVAVQELSLLGILCSLIVYFWVNNLLLLNQVPDFFADQTVGRRNILTVYGLKTGLRVYLLSALLSWLILLWVSVILASVYGWVLLSLWGGVFAWQAYALIKGYKSLPAGIQSLYESKNAGQVLASDLDYAWLKEWQPVLGLNVAINILLPLSLAALLILHS